MPDSEPAVPARAGHGAAGRRVSLARLAKVTAGLVVGGAVAGGVTGIVGSMLWALINGAAPLAFSSWVWTFAGGIGAVFGAVMMPIGTFTVMRYVPLWRVFAETTVMATLGGVVGVQFLGAWWLAGPIGGFVLAAVRLWRSGRRGRKRGGEPAG